jgi:hypothetical protein
MVRAHLSAPHSFWRLANIICFEYAAGQQGWFLQQFHQPASRGTLTFASGLTVPPLRQLALVALAAYPALSRNPWPRLGWRPSSPVQPDSPEPDQTDRALFFNPTVVQGYLKNLKNQVLKLDILNHSSRPGFNGPAGLA